MMSARRKRAAGNCGANVVFFDLDELERYFFGRQITQRFEADVRRTLIVDKRFARPHLLRYTRRLNDRKSYRSDRIVAVRRDRFGGVLLRREIRNGRSGRPIESSIAAAREGPLRRTAR